MQINKKPKIVSGFLDFVREQGVVGLAVGFILGGAVSKLVSAIVNDIVNPLLSMAMGGASALREWYFQVNGVKILYGDLISSFIDFFVIALVVYFGFKLLKLDKIDKKKE
jgi:large conductance mechanosensitive channel